MDLFTQTSQQNTRLPLSVRMRPRTLKEFVGQEHIVGENKLLSRAIQADKITSLILYGPPGVGKNCLSLIISNITKSHFEEINATVSNVAELRDIIERARNRKQHGKKDNSFYRRDTSF